MSVGDLAARHRGLVGFLMVGATAVELAEIEVSDDGYGRYQRVLFGDLALEANRDVDLAAVLRGLAARIDLAMGPSVGTDRSSQAVPARLAVTDAHHLLYTTDGLPAGFVRAMAAALDAITAALPGNRRAEPAGDTPEVAATSGHTDSGHAETSALHL